MADAHDAPTEAPTQPISLGEQIITAKQLLLEDQRQRRMKRERFSPFTPQACPLPEKLETLDPEDYAPIPTGPIVIHMRPHALYELLQSDAWQAFIERKFNDLTNESEYWFYDSKILVAYDDDAPEFEVRHADG